MKLTKQQLIESLVSENMIINAVIDKSKNGFIAFWNKKEIKEFGLQ